MNAEKIEATLARPKMYSVSRRAIHQRYFEQTRARNVLGRLHQTEVSLVLSS